jgi:hypothetical protein
MTASATLFDSLLLPEAVRDAHIVAAEAMLSRLAGSFPVAGLGITGSVGTGTHREGSDLDLVVVDASFKREMQFATTSEGISTAILCLHPGFDPKRELRWTLAAGGDVVMVAMVRSAFIARDPAGHLREVQRTVTRLDEARRTRRDELIALRAEHALSAVRMLHAGTGPSDEHLQLELFFAVVDGWFLQHGLPMETQPKTKWILETIAERDTTLSALLRSAVPLTHGSMAPLLRAVDHVFGPWQVSN